MKLKDLHEAMNHMGEREQQTYSGWKRACKKAYPGCAFRGDIDIGAATLNGHDVGEWDGSVGCVYKTLGKDIKEAKDMTGYVAKNGNKFFVDREDEGRVISKPGQSITFTHGGKLLKATVSSKASGRDDDVYELVLME